MGIRARLIALTVLLQLGALALLSGGMGVVFSGYGQKQVARSEELMRHAVARTALDALIQKDQVQLLSYLNFLKGQYPALVYARVLWRKGDKTVERVLGATTASGDVDERRVVVNDPNQPGQEVSVVFGVDRAVLDAPFAESRRRVLRTLLWVSLGAGATGVLVALLVAHRMTRPLTALGRLAEQIGHGRLGARLEWESQDEIGVLAGAFNMMSERLEELDTVKRNFISSVTHELRSPLGAIESFLQLIRERVAQGPAGFAQSADYLERIEVNVRRLSSFINDLLDAAKIEQGKMECVLRPMPLGPVARDVVQFFEAKASRQGVALQSRLPELPPVMADAERVRQVLVNLVANGLKFTPSGGRVWIEGEQFRDAARRWIEVTVADNGRGMEEADRQRLFQAFVQGANVARHIAGHKGTGLGLYIVKSILDQHGGRIEVKSAPGRGTRVSFTLKVAD